MSVASRIASPLVIIGQGRVGTALAAALTQAAVPVEHLAARDLPSSLAAEAYLLAVRDPQIAATARAVLARHAGPPPLLMHTAGGLPSAVLREAGASAAAVLHPLVAFAAGPPPSMRGALFAVEGDEVARALAVAIVERLGGCPQVLDAKGLARYHAAAALASNHVLALVDLGREIFDGLGIDPVLGATGLASLFAAVAHNLGAVGLPGALTGPIARGDVAAVQRHLDALAPLPAARAAYLATADRLCLLARHKGDADLAGLLAIEALLSLYAPSVLD